MPTQLSDGWIDVLADFFNHLTITSETAPTAPAMMSSCSVEMSGVQIAQPLYQLRRKTTGGTDLAAQRIEACHLVRQSQAVNATAMKANCRSNTRPSMMSPRWAVTSFIPRPVAAIGRRQTDPKPYFLVLRCLVSLQRILAVSDGVSPKA